MSKAGGSKPGTSKGLPSRGNAGKTPKSGTAGTNKRTAGSMKSGLTALTEDDDDDDDLQTLGTELSAIVPRATYRPPREYYNAHITRFQKYLEDTEVEIQFRKLLHVLLSRPELPYNPYPGFYNRLRSYQESFHLNSVSRGKVLSSIENPVKDTYIQNLYTLKEHHNLFGLMSILRIINPVKLEKYRWLIDDVTPRLDELYSLDGYSNQVMLAMVGQCVFDGSLYTDAHLVQLRLEYLVSGPDIQQGISIFVNSVMNDIDQTYRSPNHFLLGVKVPSASAINPEIWVQQYWDPERVQSDKETFLQKLSDAVIGNKFIYAECIFLLDPSYVSYVKGEKQYGFNFIEVVQELKEEGLSSFCEFPMASLHEGIFYSRAQAEAYVSIFQVQMNDFEYAEAHEAGEGAPPPSPGIVSPQPGPSTQVPPHTARIETARSENRRLTASQQRDAGKIRKHLDKQMEKIQPQKVRIDGFRFGEEKSTGAYAWQITTPLKAHYQRKVASHWRTVEIPEIIYCIIMLVLMDRSSYEDEILVEIYRVLHGTVGHLHMLLEHNKSLRAIIQAISNTNDYMVIKNLLAIYRQSVKDVFLNPLLERSEDHVTIGQSICAKIEDMIIAEEMDFGSASHLQFTLRGLKNINLYMIPLMMEVAEDSLAKSPEISKMIDMFEQTFEEENPRPKTRYKRRVTTSFKAGEDEESTDVIKHGVEDEHIRRHETSVLNVKTCISKDMSPQVMVKENVLMKYMLDCRFDEMWHEYLIDLAGGDIFPPNPFPRLISSVRKCAQRMDLFYEKGSVVTEKMFNLEVKLEDPDNFVYHIPGIEAHGCVTALIMLDTGTYLPISQMASSFQQSSYIQKKGAYMYIVGICIGLSGPIVPDGCVTALMMLDTGTYLPISQMASSFQQRSYIQKKGAYRVGICMALSGPSIWYGRMQPYLNEIEIHEHYYIQGPSGCHGEAIQLCAVMVHNHMTDMITKSPWPVMGVYFGSPSPDHWTKDDILTKKKGFLTQFATIAALKQPIYCKAYVTIEEWRYVTLVKHFKLHFMEEGTRPELFYPDDPASFYKSVFLSKDRAAFHYQNYGPPQGGDPMSMANVRAVCHSIEKSMFQSQRRCDWLNYYRHLLLRDLISQDQSHIADCWRILHCMAGQIEYTTGMMEVLQDLVITCLQSGDPLNQQQSRQNSRQSSSNKKKNPVEDSILTKMVIAFYQKLMYVCEARLTMAARSLTDFIENKLKSALEFDPESGRPYLAIEDQTIFRLEEMKSIMKIFQDTLSGDVRNVLQSVTISYKPERSYSPQGISKIPMSSAKNKGHYRSRGQLTRDPYVNMPDTVRTSSRPASVASNILNNPLSYSGNNANRMIIK